MQKKIFFVLTFFAVISCFYAPQALCATLTFDSGAEGLSLGGSMTWNGTGGGHLYCESYGNDDWFTFSSPTHVTSFQMNYMPWQGYGGGSGSNVTIKAFNVSGQEIWSSTQDLSGYKSWTSWKTVAVNTANVSKMTFYATNGFWPSIDNLVINTVTETPALTASNTNFGNVRVGTSANASVTVTNTGTSGSTLTGNIGAASGAEFSPVSGTQSFSLGQNQGYSRTYTYTPSARGADSTNVTVSSNATNSTLTLTGTGVSPVFHSSVAAGSTIDFGEVGYIANQALTIQNLTTDPDLGNLTDMTLLSAVITGADANYFTLQGFNPGTKLSKNQLQNLSIEFMHTYGGRDDYGRVRNATLTITTDVNAALGNTGTAYSFSLQAVTIPEPGTIHLLGIFLLLAFCKKNLKF
ncbi:MAG: choice-of-anchor D domain-containing protein [Candidatus Brocadiae bacterium]|nr:choice-of-anchor D domain-containing protein [Candidatus Brocadiia bacterium]